MHLFGSSLRIKFKPCEMFEANVLKKQFLYGITDIKFPSNSDIEIKIECPKKKPLDSYKFRLPPDLRGVNRIPWTWVPRRLWATPDTLVQITPENPLPDVFKWTNVDICHWLDRLGFPQYRNTFHENYINGRTLLLVDASKLAAMNVRRFDHIKQITKAIRNLYKVEMILFSRSISLPPRYPETHYKLYRVQTGFKYDSMRPKDLWRMMKILDEPPRYETHWATLERWLKHYPDYQTKRIGYARRRNLYKAKKAPPQNKLDLPKKHVDNCDCMPPCECEFTEKHLREPWILEYLKRFIPVEDDDLMVCLLCGERTEEGDHTCQRGETEGGNKKFEDSVEHVKCTCIPPCECKWTERDLAPRSVIRVLKVKIARRYTVDINNITNRRSTDHRKSCESGTCSSVVLQDLKKSSFASILKLSTVTEASKSFI